MRILSPLNQNLLFFKANLNKSFFKKSKNQSRVKKPLKKGLKSNKKFFIFSKFLYSKKKIYPYYRKKFFKGSSGRKKFYLKFNTSNFTITNKLFNIKNTKYTKFSTSLLLQKLNNLHLNYILTKQFNKQPYTKKLTVKLLKKFSTFLKNYCQTSQIQLNIFYKIYNFLRKFKKNKLLFFKLIEFKNKQKLHLKSPKIHFLTFSYKKFKKCYFKTLKQKYFTKKYFKNNEFFLTLLNCLFNRFSTLYLVIYIGLLFKRLKKHYLFLSHINRVIKYFFTHYSEIIPVKGLKIIIKGRINRNPRKKTKIYSYGTTQTQTLTTRFDFNQFASDTRSGTFGLKIWRYF